MVIVLAYVILLLGERPIVAISETTPFLGELLEDVEISVKSLAQEILKEMEYMSGESLRHMWALAGPVFGRSVNCRGFNFWRALGHKQAQARVSMVRFFFFFLEMLCKGSVMELLCKQLSQCICLSFL
jgi:hypothetical protein